MNQAEYPVPTPLALTHEQQLFNCLLARHLWVKRVKPDSVVRRLHSWKCGTQACFGGHLATWPEFQEIMGVSVSASGAPVLNDVPTAQEDRWLFGRPHNDVDLFDPRAFNEQGSDWEVVLNRLDTRIEELRKVLA